MSPISTVAGLQAQGNAHDIIPALFEQSRGNGAVNSAAHAYKYALQAFAPFRFFVDYTISRPTMQSNLNFTSRNHFVFLRNIFVYFLLWCFLGVIFRLAHDYRKIKSRNPLAESGKKEYNKRYIEGLCALDTRTDPCAAIVYTRFTFVDNAALVIAGSYFQGRIYFVS